jgi:cytochrome c biogenesis protein CcmG/thiol:disulfide interchange protein DsbE
MRSFIAVVIGLAVGFGAAVGVGVAVVALTPAPVVRVTPAPPASQAAPSPGSPSATTPASPAPGAGGSSPAPAPSGVGASASPSPSGSVSPFPLVGKPAPPLTAPQVGGGTIDLAALRGKPIWLVFTGTYCPPCRDEYPVMNAFAARYADTGLVVIAVHVREGEDVVAPFIASLNVVFPVGLDADGSRARAWDAAVLPLHYFIDAQGIVRDAALGGIGPDVMARGLQEILPGVTVTL